MVKRVIRKPVEKLSESENVMVIDSSSEDDSSSDEENFVAEIPKQEILTKQPNKVSCDICGKEFSKGGIRMHRISCEKKQGSLAKSVPIQKKQVAPEIDEDDKPMTARQLKALLASQNAPPVKKERKPYTRRNKVEPTPSVSPTPPPTPKNIPSQIRWA